MFIEFCKRMRSASLAAACTALVACGGNSGNPSVSDGPGPKVLDAAFVHPSGDPVAGKEVFRYETFGNQRFWTDLMKLPQGIAAAGLTPLQALKLGLNVNFDALNAPTQQALGAALAAVNAGADPNSTAFGDPAVTLSLINQNAVQGVVAFDPTGTRKPLGNTGTLDLAAGDKVGLTCAACHSITDNSVLPPSRALGTPGSVGKAVDGPIAEGIDVGAILAAAQNSRAYFPLLQIAFNALGGASIGHGGHPGLKVTGSTIPTEAEADNYLTGSGANGRYYPRVSFDAFPDGIGNPTYIQQLFRTKLSAPWGFDGGVAQLQDFNNTVYTVALDPTGLLTTGGRAALRAVAGDVGDEIADSYRKVLVGTGVLGAGVDTNTVYPLITATRGLTPGAPGSIIGLRVDETKLRNLNGYLDSLPGPAQVAGLDQAAVARGKEMFRNTSDLGGKCTACHQVDPNQFVPTQIVPIATLYPGYAPTVIAPRAAPLTDIQNSGGISQFFDDRLVVFDASLRTDGLAPARAAARGYALPMLLDLDRKLFLLNDSSVGGTSFAEAANKLLDPARGSTAAHPFYIPDASSRSDVVQFLRSLAAN